MLNTPLVGASAIRRDCTAAAVHSRRVRRPERERLLERHGSQIRMLQIQGELTFASAEVVTRALKERFEATQFVVLDMHRVSSIDAPATELLLLSLEGFEAAKKRLVFARVSHLTPLIEAMIRRRDHECLSIADDPLEALEQCEEELLDQLQSVQTLAFETSLEDQQLVQGLTPGEIQLLKKQITRRIYGAGEVIVREGDLASQLYFISQGHVSVLLGNPVKPSAVIAHVNAGMCIGEMAMIDRGPRSASVRADLPTICLELPFSALDQPEMGEIRHKLLANFAKNLSERLRKANAEIRAMT
jgi:hypothetical protein